jgi:hypothetical protein
MTDEAIGIAAGLGSAASWALGAILFKRIGENMSPLAMTLLKSLLSVVLLGAALIFTGWVRPTEYDLWLLVASGLIGIALGDTLFFAALQHLGPQTLVVLMMVGQVLTAVLALVFLGERPPWTAWAGMGCVLAGVGVVLWSNLGGERQPSRLRGITLGLLATLCMSVSIIMAKPAMGEMSALQATFLRMAAGAGGIVLLGIATRQLGAWAGSCRKERLAGQFFAAVCVVTFGGFWLSLLANQKIEVAIANTLISLEPVFVLPLAAIFLKEKITRPQILGTIIALAGAIVLCNT